MSDMRYLYVNTGMLAVLDCIRSIIHIPMKIKWFMFIWFSVPSWPCIYVHSSHQQTGGYCVRACVPGGWNLLHTRNFEHNLHRNVHYTAVLSSVFADMLNLCGAQKRHWQIDFCESFGDTYLRRPYSACVQHCTARTYASPKLPQKPICQCRFVITAVKNSRLT